MNALIAFFFGGIIGWMLENAVAKEPRYSHAFGKAPIPFLPVYGAGAAAVALAAPELGGVPWWGRGLIYAAGLSSVEFGACALDRSLGQASWCYEPGACRELSGCVSVPHALAWGLLGLGVDAVVRSTDAKPSTLGTRVSPSRRLHAASRQGGGGRGQASSLHSRARIGSAH